ncbi:hypothetical protein [Clostridium sp. AWRP]|uniref:hypothetical protein n=1 Tax=Clostridium sp. AWRP TaxID=2212991 RepID=UPI000FDB04C3|nr:hypothetical protein [Clostridium sp. AWRP]AZV58824.1 hypothetical protein DMR38_20810 [Clostridium sp. AWRP]
MAVDVSQQTSLIRQGIKGKDVREALASGIEKIAGDENQFETDMMQQETDYQRGVEQRIKDFENTQKEECQDFEASMEDKQQSYEKNITGRQDNLENRQGKLEVRQTSLENTFDQEIENAVSDNPSSAETVYARTDHVNNKTYHNLGERLDTLINLLGYIPVDGGSFFEEYIEFAKDGGTF